MTKREEMMIERERIIKSVIEFNENADVYAVPKLTALDLQIPILSDEDIEKINEINKLVNENSDKLQEYINMMESRLQSRRHHSQNLKIKHKERA